MKIGIIGYGRMGHEVEKIAMERGHSIVTTIDPSNGMFPALSEDAIREAEGFIEFSPAEGTLDHIEFLAKRKIPHVVGNTGWDALVPEARKIAENAGGALLYGSNFSIGANLFFRMVSQAAALINSFDDYDIMLAEYHHKNKIDSPSGTALTIANKILEANNQKQKICTDVLQRKIEPDELHVAAIRGGAIPGIHTVTLDSSADSITISHNARNRGGFALGSVMGLEWVSGKNGAFHVDDFFEDLTSAGA